jgi:tetratricopeptide (TPR) repeat protein
MRVPAFLLVVCLSAVAAQASSGSPQKTIDSLFDALKHAQSPEDAKPIEQQIGVIFLESGSASVDLLMTRGTAALTAGDNDTARKLFTAVTEIAPGYAEGWRQRAQLEVAANNDGGAMVSLQRVITLNPRHFSAMAELAGLLEDYGDKGAALKLYRRALALDPQLEGIDRHVKALTTQVEGQGI